MDISITMFDVKDGDAILVELTKKQSSLVMAIDGGHSSDYKNKIKPKLDEVLQKYQKAGPDIIVCTHYDSDHIGGLILMIQEYKEHVKQVWVHRTPEVISMYTRKAEKLLNEQQKHVGSFSLFEFQNLFESVSEEKRTVFKNESQILLESLQQLKTLLELIPPNKIKEVFSGDQPLENWPEIKVIGPTREYFNSLFPVNKSLNDFVVEEVTTNAVEQKFNKRFVELAGINSCDLLKDDTSASITSTNKASIIIAIDNEDKRYLFTGDAGIESFKHIPNWKNELAKLYFLKVPHHGSNNNMSKELADVMQPVYAYCSGDKYQDDEVLKCLKSKARNQNVRTTKTEGDLTFPINQKWT